jgi:hypothetical protein
MHAACVHIGGADRPPCHPRPPRWAVRALFGRRLTATPATGGSPVPFASRRKEARREAPGTTLPPSRAWPPGGDHQARRRAFPARRGPPGGLSRTPRAAPLLAGAQAARPGIGCRGCPAHPPKEQSGGAGRAHPERRVARWPRGPCQVAQAVRSTCSGTTAGASARAPERSCSGWRATHAEIQRWPCAVVSRTLRAAQARGRPNGRSLTPSHTAIGGTTPRRTLPAGLA